MWVIVLATPFPTATSDNAYWPFGAPVRVKSHLVAE